jgi:hypothetical protein
MRSLATAVAVAAALACRSSPERAAPPPVPTVSAADLGRLAPEQMGPITTARGDLDAARDAIARARLRLQDSRHEEGFAQADRTQADADRQRAEAEARGAREAGDARLVARAQELGGAAALRAQAADARLDYARKLAAAREAEVQAAEARARRVEWEVERAKLSALRTAQIPAASKYDPAPLERRVAEAARAEDAARVRAGELGRAAIVAQGRWRSLVDRYEARARGAGSTGVAP